MSCFIARTYFREARVVWSLGYSRRRRQKYLFRLVQSKRTKTKNILCSLVLASTPTTLHHLPDKPRVDSLPDDGLHHGQMFEIVMSLEQSISREEFHEDTPDTPNIAGETPAQVQDNLGSPVVSRGDHRRVVLIIEGGRPEVDQPDLTI